MTITRYGQVMASVSGFAFVTILVTFAFYGRIRFDIRRFLMTVLVGFRGPVGHNGHSGVGAERISSCTRRRTI